MTVRDRVFGPMIERAREGLSQLEVASLTLDIDGLREFHQELSKHRRVVIGAMSGHSGPEIAVDSVDELLKLAPFDRREMAFRTEDYQPTSAGFRVTLATHTAGTVDYQPGTLEDADIRRAFLALDQVANRRLRPRMFRGPTRLLVFLGVIALYAWAWHLAPLKRTWPLLVLVGVALIPTLLWFDRWVRLRFRRIDERTHVVRILEISREQVQQDRWNRKTTLKWTVPTVIVTATITVLITVLIQHLAG